MGKAFKGIQINIRDPFFKVSTLFLKSDLIHSIYFLCYDVVPIVFRMYQFYAKCNIHVTMPLYLSVFHLMMAVKKTNVVH